MIFLLLFFCCLRPPCSTLLPHEAGGVFVSTSSQAAVTEAMALLHTVVGALVATSARAVQQNSSSPRTQPRGRPGQAPLQQALNGRTPARHGSAAAHHRPARSLAGCRPRTICRSRPAGAQPSRWCWQFLLSSQDPEGREARSPHWASSRSPPGPEAPGPGWPDPTLITDESFRRTCSAQRTAGGRDAARRCARGS